LEKRKQIKELIVVTGLTWLVLIKDL